MSAELTNGAEAPTLKTGFHYLPESVYHGLNACSNSRLSILKKSPAHLFHSLKHQLEATAAMKLGTLIHKAVLEPEAFRNSYVVIPDLTEGILTKDGKPASNPKNTSEYKERFSNFAKANIGKEFISQDDFDTAMAIQQKLYNHPRIGLLLSEISQTELSALWQCSETGLLCKARIDGDSSDLEAVIDLKTTSDASPAGFEPSIANFGYHRQAAMYLDAMRELGRTRTDYIIIAVETEAPYECAAYRLRDEIIELGRRELAPLKRLYKACQEQNVWPGYPTEIQDIGLPAWAKSKIEKEII